MHVILFKKKLTRCDEGVKSPQDYSLDLVEINHGRCGLVANSFKTVSQNLATFKQERYDSD